MVKTSSKSALLEQFKQVTALLEQEQEEEQAANTTQQNRLAQLSFWSEMREIIGVNESSVGLEVLDDIAEAIIDKTGNASDALSGLITILPKPSRQRMSRQAADHHRFSNYTDFSSPSSSSPRSSPTKTSKKRKDPPPAKSTKYFPHELADRTPDQVKRDVEKIYRKAASLKVSPYERAYPWEGSIVWYDPEIFSDLHLYHWRFWMKNRPKFWDWQLNVPLRGSSAQTQRRKAKMSAIIERLDFISFCIETWGYYEFLKRIEAVNSSRLLMWWGGQPGKNSPDAKSYHGPIIQNLSELFRHDQQAYCLKIRDSLKPFRIDDGGFSNITDLLVQTDALNPSQGKPENRLSERALARVRLDICSKEDPQSDHWVGDLSRGVWSKLVHCTRLQKLGKRISDELEAGKYPFPVVEPFNRKEEKISGYSPFKHSDGSYTASVFKDAKGSSHTDQGKKHSKDGSTSDISETDSDNGKSQSNKRKVGSRKNTDIETSDTEEIRSDEDEEKPPAKKSKTGSPVCPSK